LPTARTERTPSGIPLPRHDPKPDPKNANKGEGRGRHFSAKVPQFPPDKFQVELDAIKPEDWGRYQVYVYRTYPIIDHHLSGRPNAYIDKLETHVGEIRAYLERMHGGGEYFLILDDKNKVSGTAVCRSVIEIPWHQAPPVLITDELILGNPKNRGYEEFLWARNEHPEQEGNMRAPQQAAAPAGTVSDLVKLMLPILEKALNKDISPQERAYIDYLKTQAEGAAAANDPTKLVAMFASLKTLFAPSGESKPDNIIVTMLQDELRSLREANNKLQERFFDLATKKPDAPNLLAQVKDIAAVIGAVKDAFGRVVPAAESVHPRTAMIQAISEGVQPLLEALPGVLSTWALSKAAAAGVKIEPGVHYPITPEVLPPSAEPAGQGSEEGAPAPNGAGNAMPIPPQMMQRAIELTRMMFSAIEREIPGNVWAGSFLDLNGVTVYRQICGLGRDRLLQIMNSVPEFQPRIQALGPVLIQFIDDFINGPEEGEADEEQEPEESPAAAAPARPANQFSATFRRPPASPPQPMGAEKPQVTKPPTAPEAPPSAPPSASPAGSTPATSRRKRGSSKSGP